MDPGAGCFNAGSHRQEVHHYTLSALLLLLLLLSAPPSLSNAASSTSWRSPVVELALMLLDTQILYMQLYSAESA